MKKMYIVPETKISEFKTQMMCLSVDNGEKADDGEVLGPPRNDEENWGNLWK